MICLYVCVYTFFSFSLLIYLFPLLSRLCCGHKHGAGRPCYAQGGSRTCSISSWVSPMIYLFIYICISFSLLLYLFPILSPLCCGQNHGAGRPCYAQGGSRTCSISSWAPLVLSLSLYLSFSFSLLVSLPSPVFFGFMMRASSWSTPTAILSGWVTYAQALGCNSLSMRIHLFILSFLPPFSSLFVSLSVSWCSRRFMHAALSPYRAPINRSRLLTH